MGCVARVRLSGWGGRGWRTVFGEGEEEVGAREREGERAQDVEGEREDVERGWPGGLPCLCRREWRPRPGREGGAAWSWLIPLRPRSACGRGRRWTRRTPPTARRCRLCQSTAPTGHGGGHPRRPPPSRRPPLPHLGNFASSPPRPLPHPCPCPLTAAAGRQSSPLGGAIGHWPWWPALATRRLDVGGQSNPAGRRATRARPPFPPAHPLRPRYPPGRPRPGAAAWCARWPRDRAASRREHAVASTCGTYLCDPRSVGEQIRGRQDWLSVGSSSATQGQVKRELRHVPKLFK